MSSTLNTSLAVGPTGEPEDVRLELTGKTIDGTKNVFKNVPADAIVGGGVGGGVGGHDIYDEAVFITKRTKLSFFGEMVSVRDNSSSDSNDVFMDAKTVWLYT